SERTVIRRDARAPRPEWRGSEFMFTSLAALLVAIGLLMAYYSKSQTLTQAEQALAAKKLIDLNTVASRDELLPALNVISDLRTRQEAADKIFARAGKLVNVGGIRHALT